MDILSKIVEDKKQQIFTAKKLISLEDMADRAKMSAEGLAARGFVQALEGRVRNAGLGVIAEFKRESPSAGEINSSAKISDVAKVYERGGAACMSVLTDAKYFGGSNQDLIDARESASLPVLRKDFTVEPYQVYEARYIGADAILLIASILTSDEICALDELAFELGMDVLLEAKNKEEIDKVMGCNTKSKLLGINSRDLRTFNVSLDVLVELSNLIPDDYLVVAESGIKSAEDVRSLVSSGLKSFLIGTYFMKSDLSLESVDEITSLAM